MKTGVIVVGKADGKAEAFHCTHLGHVKCSSLLKNPARNGPDRPIWLSVAASPQELRAVEANLRMGRTLKVGSWTLELLKSTPYVWSKQSTAAASVLTVYLPDVFRVDPGAVDPNGVGFYVLPSQRWCDDYAAKNAAEILRAVADIAREPEYAVKLIESAPRAVWMLSMLNSRTRCPIIREIGFAIRVMQKASSHMLLNYGGDIECVGMAHGFSFESSHTQLERLLAQCVKEHFGVSAEKEAA